MCEIVVEMFVHRKVCAVCVFVSDNLLPGTEGKKAVAEKLILRWKYQSHNCNKS